LILLGGRRAPFICSQQQGNDWFYQAIQQAKKK
jgi:hypothetical protein